MLCISLQPFNIDTLVGIVNTLISSGFSAFTISNVAFGSSKLKYGVNLNLLHTFIIGGNIFPNEL